MTNYKKRKRIIRKLQKKRNSTIITYFTLTDRANTPPLLVSDDAMMPIHSLLEQIGPKETIELFLYTRGGSVMSAVSIVKMFREYAKKFNVIIPFRALSAGTQIALGADSIVMGKIGQLSPVDPSTANVFNPLLNPKGNPADPRNRKQISVEDVQSYLNLAKERVGLVSESDSLEVFKELTRYYEPLALGNVNRVYTETRDIAHEMLTLHMDEEKDEEKISQIIRTLTEDYTHHFLLTRDVAKKVGLNIVKPSVEEEKMFTSLFKSYEAEMKMNTPFNAEAVLAQQQPSTPSQQSPATPRQTPATPQQPTIRVNPSNFKLKLGAVESGKGSFIFVSEGSVYPPLSQLIPQVIAQPGMYPPTPPVRVKLGAWVKYTKVSGNFA